MEPNDYVCARLVVCQDRSIEAEPQANVGLLSIVVIALAGALIIGIAYEWFRNRAGDKR